MTFQNIGLLSLGIAAATLTVYATTTTNAQTPKSSVSGHEHNHIGGDQHSNHEHSDAPSSEEQPVDPFVVPAPSGGPPPLPDQRAIASSPQDTAQQREPAPNNQADSPPTLLPSVPDGNFDCPLGNYTCPNVERYRSHIHHGDWPLNAHNLAYPFESRLPPSAVFYSHGPLDFGSPYQYGGYGSSTCFPDDHRFHCGHELHGQRLYHGGRH